MRLLSLTARIEKAIEAYRAAMDAQDGLATLRAMELSELVTEAYVTRQAEYDALTAYQKRVLANSWRDHRRAEVLEQRGGAAAGRPMLAYSRQQTGEALLARRVVDEQGFLTPAGTVLAQRAWQDAGAMDAREPTDL